MTNGSGLILQGSTAYVLIVVKFYNATVNARLVCVFQIAPGSHQMRSSWTTSPHQQRGMKRAERNEENTHRT